MKIVETPSKAQDESSSLLQESSTNSDSRGKLSKRAYRTPVKITRENGLRVSLNGKEDFDGTQVSADKDLRDENEGGLEDSEMNGVSSLLKMQESKGLRGLGSVLDVIDRNENRGFESSDGVSLVADVSLDGNEGYPYGESKELDDDNDIQEEENMGEDEVHEFAIGDFVWGKIRSHPWWPGRIYDPIDASDYAKKVKQKDKILVAYFGDGTFAWCNPSQLKPLDENFLEMSNQSCSKNFVNAVENAMDEVGRLVDLKMTCSCVPKDNLIGFGRTLVVNAGIKEGLLIPEGGIDKFSSALFEPAEFLSTLKGAAQVPSISNMLEFTVLKSWLSAFYRAKGGYQLPSYYDAKPVPGLEDKSRNSTVDLSDHIGVEVRIQGPEEEEDWLSSPAGPKYGQTNQSILHKCQGVSEDRPHQRRKQKSLAEIMEGQCDVQATENKNNVLGEGGKLSSKRKKRKYTRDSMGTEGQNEVTDETEGANLGKTSSTSGGKKKKSIQGDNEGQHEMEDAAKGGENLGEPHPSSGRKKRKVSDQSDVAGDSKPRKGMKLSQSLATIKADSSRVKNSEKSPLSRERKKGKFNIKDVGGGGENEEMEESSKSFKKKVDGSRSKKGKTKEQTENNLPRERKRSKYLSPPYTDINKGRNKEVEAESLKVSSEARLGERLTNAASHLVGSQNQLSKETVSAHETSESSGLQTPKQNQVFDPLIVEASTNDILSKIRSAALNPMYMKDTGSLDMVGEFFSAFRSSSYFDGSSGEHSEHRLKREMKSQVSARGSSEEEPSANHISLDNKSGWTKAKESEKKAKLNEPKEKQAASAPLDMKMKGKESNGEALGATLFVTFGPGSTLPAKNELIKIYGKFGALNEKETEMFYANYCAKVVFLRSSDAEEAFNQSQLSSPFGSANATFRLRYLSAETKTRELRDISRKPSSLSKEGAKTQDKPSASQSSDKRNASQLNFIKQKLEMITSLLETSEGKISPDMKSILEAEITVLLEKVTKMVSSN